MAQPCYHPSIEGAQHGAKTLAQFLDYARKSGATGAQPSNFMLHEGEKQSFGFSGLGGSRMGPVAIKRFFRVQAMYANRLDGNVPWWFK